MKPSIFGTLTVFTVACLLIVQAHQECTCGGLGKGTNPCSCSDVVVKASKLPKPTHYVSIQKLKEAVTSASNDASQNDCSNSQATSNVNVVQENSQTITTDASPCSKHKHNHGKTCGCGGKKQTSNTENIQTESIVVYTDTSSEISPESTIVYRTDVSYSDESDSKSNEAKSSSCGCKKISKQNIETLDVAVPVPNANIVPKFSPVGDLCYPLPVEPDSGRIVERTKVTPAYPGKIVCCPPSVPYEICINTATGEARGSMMAPGTSNAPSVSTGGNNGMTIGVSHGSFGASKPSSHGNVNSALFGGSRPFISSVAGAFGGPTSNSMITFSGPKSHAYNLPLVYANLKNTNGHKHHSKVISSSDCFDKVTGGSEVDYSYPAMPADAVSLTLAYKNLRAPNVIYRQGKQFVPEDKLSFGHRTVPVTVKNEKQTVDIAEEKLVTVNKPVVELKLAAPKTVVIGSYNEQEEAKLAELEAFERESIMQEESADQISESLISYSDLGYAPVGATYVKNYNQAMSDLDDSAEVPCGPLGPPVSGYVPGSVIVKKQKIRGGSYNSGIAKMNGNVRFDSWA